MKAIEKFATASMLFVLAAPSCHQVPIAKHPDVSFCAISEQVGKPLPSMADVETIHGRYAVNLYSVDSGKILGTLDITLTPTDTMDRFYQQMYDEKGVAHLQRRKEPLLAKGDERHLIAENRKRGESALLFYSDRPNVSVFAAPDCIEGPRAPSSSRPTYACSFSGTGLELNIKQVKPYGFAGTVSQVGVGTAEKRPGGQWQFIGPHFFCAMMTKPE